MTYFRETRQIHYNIIDCYFRCVIFNLISGSPFQNDLHLVKIMRYRSRFVIIVYQMLSYRIKHDLFLVFYLLEILTLTLRTHFSRLDKSFHLHRASNENDTINSWKSYLKLKISLWIRFLDCVFILQTKILFIIEKDRIILTSILYEYWIVKLEKLSFRRFRDNSVQNFDLRSMNYVNRIW